MESSRSLWSVPPQLPERKEIVSQAEPGFADRESRLLAPPLRQLVAVEEDMSRLLDRPGAGMVDVAIIEARRHT